MLSLGISGMRDHFVLAAVILASGVYTLRKATRTGQSGKSIRWRIWTALASGPAIAMTYLLVDVFWLAPYSYQFISDYSEIAIPVVIIGTTCGLIVAVALWATDFLNKLCEGKSSGNLE